MITSLGVPDQAMTAASITRVSVFKMRVVGGPRERTVTPWGQRHTGPMTTVSRTFTVTPPPSVVLDYLKDFAHAEAWDPGTETCTRNDAGPVKVGSTWHNVSKIAGVSTELTYELTELTDDRVQFVGTNDTATSTDTIAVVPHEGGSQVTYEAVIEMNGAAKLAGPIIKLVFEKIGNDTEDDMVRVLNGLESV